MRKINSKTRFLTALNHEEPDRVPLFELGIDSVPILKKYGRKKYESKLWNRTKVQLYKNMHMDCSVIPVAMYPHSITPEKYIDEFGRQFKYLRIQSGDQFVKVAYYERGCFDTENPEASYEDWERPDPDNVARVIAYKDAIRAAKDKIYLIPGITGFVEKSWEPFSFHVFTKLLYKNPQFIERVARDLGEFSTALAKNMLDLGAETILVYDDSGYKSGPFYSPKLYKKLVVPQLEKLCNTVHSYDAKVLLHSDGKIYKLLDLMIKAGIDGLHPIEAGSGMDIFRLKKDYGDKLCLIGNVDPIALLTHGTPEKVTDYVRRLMQECAPGGGYVLASGHTLTYSVKVDNFDAMIAAALKYGYYPIEME